MEELKNFEKHLENAIEWFWDFIPDLILAVIILDCRLVDGSTYQ